MTKKEKIMATIATMILIAAFSVTVVFAVTGYTSIPDQATPRENASVVVEAVDKQAAREEAALAHSFGIKGLTDEQIDWIIYVMDNGKLPALTPEEFAELRAVLAENVEQGFMGGKISMEQIDMMLAYMETGKFEFTDEFKAELMAELKVKAGELLGQGLEEGYITQGLYNILVVAMKTGEIEYTEELEAELKINIKALLTMALAEGKITQEQYDEIVFILENGIEALTDEQKAGYEAKFRECLEQGLAEGKLPQEIYDIVIFALDNGKNELTNEKKAELEAMLHGLLDPLVAEGKLPQEHVDIVFSVLENGVPELTDEEKAEIKAHVEEKAKEALLKGLDKGFAEGFITKGVYDAAIQAVKTGEVDLTPELIKEVSANGDMLLKLCLAEGKITQEQYDKIISGIEEFTQSMALPKF